MAFCLTEDEIERAKRVIEGHDYGIFFPRQTEWKWVSEHWGKIRSHLVGLDLDAYTPREPVRSHAPKSRIGLRPVVLLHPFDLLIYTALVLIVRDDLEAQRDPPKARRVFSHRSTPQTVDALCVPTRLAHKAYRARQRQRATLKRCKVVAVTDIADFFPRVLQHPLENIIVSVASTSRSQDVARVLVRKFLMKLADGKSYGLPIGPLASGILAEAILIDVDAALIDQKFDFIRWFDDYTFFVRDDTQAQRALFFLSAWLQENHGLQLNGAKTKILRRDSFIKGITRDYEQRIKVRSEELAELWVAVGAYESQDELSDEEKKQIDQLNLGQLLQEAVEDTNGIDYEFADLILGKLASAIDLSHEQAVDLIAVVIKHIPDLYPIISSVGKFFKSLDIDKLTKKQRDKVAKALLAPLTAATAPPDFVAMWILDVFASSPALNHARRLRHVYTSTASPIVKRYAALALAATGRRSDVVVTRQDIGGAKPLVRTAILQAWRRAGRDERKHWKQMMVSGDVLEKVI